jgi:hypothetical protein
MAKDRLLEHLWHHLSFGVTLNQDEPNTSVEDFLRLARNLDRSKLKTQDANLVR